MARDAELDRLGSLRDTAFQKKQTTFAAKQSTGEARHKLAQELSVAYDAKQRAYAEQDTSWRAYQNVRSANGPRIDNLKVLQERAYQNMRQAFNDASSAHDRRDGAAARSFADSGHRYKTEAQAHTAERRRLVSEIQAARARHESTKPAFQQAKATFDSIKQRFDAAKAAHERAMTAFKQAQSEFNAAKQAFDNRLAEVRRARGDEKQRVLGAAGIPLEYHTNAMVRRNSDGSYDIFYGGIGAPDGFGHGHAVVSAAGKVTHDRKPFSDNSPENFADESSYIEYQRSRGHSGGYGLAHYGYIGGRPVTFADGWGSKSGHTLLADGHIDKSMFHRSDNHNHYGPGDGPHNNAMDRGRYTGPGA